MDNYVLANITPAVMQERDVNLMQHAITQGMYTYLVSRFEAIPANHLLKHVQRDNLSAAKRNAMHEVTEEKKLAKR